MSREPPPVSATILRKKLDGYQKETPPSRKRSNEKADKLYRFVNIYHNGRERDVILKKCLIFNIQSNELSNLGKG